MTTNKVTRKVKVIFDKEASKMVKEVKKVQEEDKEMDWRLMTNMEVLHWLSRLKHMNSELGRLGRPTIKASVPANLQVSRQYGDHALDFTNKPVLLNWESPKMNEDARRSAQSRFHSHNHPH